MAGNARFHDKLHRKNHHTLPTVGYPDSANDPIASPSEPFEGDFVVNGQLSASSGISILSAHIEQDLDCENAYVRDTTYTNFISGYGTETIISDGALTGYGDKTLTMDYRKGIYAKSPIFNVLGNVSATSALYVDDLVSIKKTLNVDDNTTLKKELNVDGNTTIKKQLSVNGDFTLNQSLSITGNILYKGTSAHYIKFPVSNTEGAIVFGGTTNGLNSNSIHSFYNLSSYADSITSDGSFDTILPYQERKIVYSGEQVTRYFFVSGSPTNPLPVPDNTSIIGIRAFAYSGDNKFNSYGKGGNASIDLKASGDQSLTNSGGYITFATMPMNSGINAGDTERMRITSEGNVGIGTWSPASVNGYTSLTLNSWQSGGRLDLQKNGSQFGLIYSAGSNLFDVEATGASTHMRFNTNLAERMRITSNGNVGIGTALPNSKLEVQGDIRIKNGYRIYLSDNSDNTNIKRDTGYNGLDLRTNDTSRLFISDDGNVGIGTLIPKEKLHVVGNVLITGNLSALGDTTQIDTTIVTTSAMVIDTSGSTDALRITQRGTGNVLLVEDEATDSTAFVINSSGNVGIGVNVPLTKLDVNGSITVPANSYINLATNSDGHTAIKRNGSDNGMEFFTNSNSRMFISDSGNVGIGTKTQLHSPNDKLEIAGNVGSYGYRVKQGIPNGSPGPDASTNGYAFGDDGDTGMFSPLNGDSEGASIGRIAWYCNNVETARTFINSQPIFTIGGLSAASETYLRTTLAVGDSNNGGLLELTDGAGGHSIIYRDAFTNSLWLQGRTDNSNIVLSTVGTGSISIGVSGNSSALLVNSNGNIGIGTPSPTTKLHVDGNLLVSELTSTKITTKSLKTSESIYLPVSSLAMSGNVYLSLNTPSYLFLNTNGAARTVILPTVTTSQAGLSFTIKNTSSLNDSITLSGNGSGIITTIARDAHAHVVYDGTNWQLI